MTASFKQRIYFVLLLGFFSFVLGCPRQNVPAKKAGVQPATQNDTLRRQDDSLSRANTGATVSRRNAITRAAAEAGPAVVGINVIQVKRYVRRSPFYTEDPFWRALFPEYFRDKVYEQKVQSLGSGFIISKDGYLVTNQHVVEDATEIIVTLPGGQRHNAKIVGSDEISDIALLKIDGRNFPYLKLGNSDDVIVGEWVIALGNPFGLFELNDQPTVTVGVVSAMNRDWGQMPNSRRIYMDMIQTDAAINHGNSGGPLVNAAGEVIGMNTFIYTGSTYEQGFVGIGFAIPINRIKNIIKQIRERGEVDRDFWLGFRVQDLNPYLVRALQLNIREGVIITQIDRGSSADHAGLQPEDVIIKVNGKPVHDTQSLQNMLTQMDLQVGDILNFEIVRDNRKQKVQFKLIHRN